MENLIDAILEAEKEAYLKGIEANAIVLNSKYDYCKEFFFGNELGITKVPPMILGKQLILGKLPDKYSFAIFHTNAKSYVEKLEEENALLKKYIKILGDGDNEQLVFKGVSSKRNKEDFENLKKIL